jgi:hypothetical protein
MKGAADSAVVAATPRDFGARLSNCVHQENRDRDRGDAEAATALTEGATIREFPNGLTLWAPGVVGRVPGHGAALTV